jgi:hypothetical protein
MAGPTSTRQPEHRTEKALVATRARTAANRSRSTAQRDREQRAGAEALDAARGHELATSPCGQARQQRAEHEDADAEQR